MFNVDKVLEERAREGGPVRVAMIGAGPLARVIALQMVTDMPGVRLVAIADDDLEPARRVYIAAGMPVPRVVESPFGLRAAIKAGEPAVTQNWRLLCDSDQIDAVIEATGLADHGAEVARAAAETGKHVIPTSSGAEDRPEAPLKPASDKVEVVRVEVDATNFFDILHTDEEGASAPPQHSDAQERPANPV